MAFLLFSFNAFAKPVKTAHFKQLAGQENLPSYYINHIIQRNDGFIWIATAEGISRYDGKNFVNHKSFDENYNSLPNPWVNYLHEDHNNQLWAGTAIGLARLLPDEINFKQYHFNPNNEKSIAGNSTVHIFEDDNNRMWFATDRGLSLYQPTSDDFINYYIDSDTSNIDYNNINAIAQKDSDHLWLGTDYGLFVFSISSGQFTAYDLKQGEEKPFEIMDLVTDKSNNLWIVTAYSGLIKLDVTSAELTSFMYDADDDNTIISDGLWTVALDQSDNVWVASWGEGISQISASDGLIHRYTHTRGDPRSLPSNITTDVFEDRNGLIWVGTFDGLAVYNPHNAIENIRPIPGEDKTLSSDLVWSFTETQDDIWVGTTEGINRWDKESGEIESYYSADGNEFTSVWTMTLADEYMLWVGTEFGLAQFDTRSHELSYLFESTLEQERSDKDIEVLKKPVWSIAKNRDDSVWVGSNMANLYLVDKELNVVVDHSDMIQSTVAQYENVEFTDITIDDKQNLWLSTASGLYFFDIKSNEIVPVRSTKGEILFTEDWIYSVKKNINNQYWIISQKKGLSLYNLNPTGLMERLFYVNYSHPDIEDRGIFTVSPVNEFEAWFTGKRNLYHVDINSQVVTNYGHSFFDEKLNIHENSQLISTDKELYLGSNRGIIKFDPEKIRLSDFQPMVYITGISSNNRPLATALSDPYLESFQQDNQILGTTPVHLLKSHVFDYKDTTFTFHFSALDYMNAENLHYAYRIAELDENWVELLNDNELTLTNLVAGDYRLEVKATNADLQWSENTATLDFILLPKPWLTWWAKLLYVITAFLIAAFIIRLYRSRLLTQYALQHREVQLSQAIWGSGDELWEWNIQKQEITRTNSSELKDNRQRQFDGSFENNTLNIHPDDINQLQLKIQQLLDNDSNEFDATYRQKRNDGSWHWMQDRAKVTQRSEDMSPLIVNGISRNINTIKEKELRSQLIASAFQSSSDGALILSADLKIVSINAAFTEITGYDQRIINRFMKKDSDKISTENMNSSALFQHILSGIEKGGSFRNEIYISTTHGKPLPVDLRVNCIYDSEKAPTHYIATLTDITYRKDTEEVLKKLANYDSLTGLPNRSLMMIQLNHALHQAEQDRKHMAIMFVDLDHFKNINDSLGHTIGDELLVAVANRLSECISTSDTIARIGGDEFTIGILSYKNIDEVIKVAENIVKAMSQPFQLENHELIITPSIGIATYNNIKTDIETLLMQADTAMYHAKEKGRNNYRFFTESMNKAVIQRVDIEMRLRKALENNELSLHYQPKFNLKSGQVSGFEALLRWYDANDVLTSPEEFIPIAEETGLIFSIGEFVIESACQELNHWRSLGHNDISVAINLSAVQFMDKKLVTRVEQFINKYNIKPMSLEIEITESTLIENLQYTIKTLKELKQLGVKLSLDDFGTGFSSLNYLKQFPIHALKIDRTFVLDMVNDPRDASMVESIINLAHNLSIMVIAEGVETTEQLDMLTQFNVEEVQGFLLSKPIDAKTVIGLLSQNKVMDLDALKHQNA